MESYIDYVQSMENLSREAAAIPLREGGDLAELCALERGKRFGKVLVFSPHPDDECIVGLLPLRLMSEAGAEVVDVAITLGSKMERRAERLAELGKACGFLRWSLKFGREGAYENINPISRDSDRASWTKKAEEIASLILAERPRLLLLPHSADWNATHKGTSLLVYDALEILGSEFTGFVVETEYWGSFDKANLMVEASPRHIAALMEALAKHVGEVSRNDYHLRLPAWMSDNVRRGAELVGGQGGAAPHFAFACLYNVRRLSGGKWEDPFGKGVFIPVDLSADSVF